VRPIEDVVPGDGPALAPVSCNIRAELAAANLLAVAVNATLGYVDLPAQVDGTRRLRGMGFSVFIEDGLLVLKLPVRDQDKPAQREQDSSEHAGEK
jgi:hypothetical protein